MAAAQALVTSLPEQQQHVGWLKRVAVVMGRPEDPDVEYVWQIEAAGDRLDMIEP